MKKILTIVAIATLSLGLGAVSFAQDAGPQGGEMQAKKHGGHAGGLKVIEKIQASILPDLHLDKDQTDKIAALNKSTEDQVKAMRKANKGSTDKAKMQADRKDLMKKYNESLKAILTSDQWKSYHKEMAAKMKELRDANGKKDGDGKP